MPIRNQTKSEKDSLYKMPARWYPLREHEPQEALAESTARFNVCAAGRRSGKTERAKRKLTRSAVEFAMLRPDLHDGYFFAGAPVLAQAKRLYWKDLKAMVPRSFIRRIYETDLVIALTTGVELACVGLDVPERLEGVPIDGIVIDEIANCKPETWQDHVRPALDTLGREGWAWLIGVPEGRNHFYEFWVDAADRDGWEQHHWRSDTVLPPHIIEAARQDLDERTFEQEYGASFIDFTGRAYYGFEEAQNVVYERGALPYDPRQPLNFCFDFNVEPGAAVVTQEARLTKEKGGGTVTLVLGEVHIPTHSNTRLVCKALIERWKEHGGPIRCYGDATGGAEGTAKLSGTDWDIIRKMIKRGFGKERVHLRVPTGNPRERQRVNAMNSRLKPLDGPPRMLFDGHECKRTIMDMAGVRTIPGTNGKLDKSDIKLTHWSDGLGYYVYYEHKPGTRVRSDEI